MRPRKRDTSFLYMALLAGSGGLISIGCAIGMPLWQHVHGQPTYPAFALFACWGIAALCGAGACLQTYFLTDAPPEKPPRGGAKLALIRNTNALPQDSTTQRRAA